MGSDCIISWSVLIFLLSICCSLVKLIIWESKLTGVRELTDDIELGSMKLCPFMNAVYFVSSVISFSQLFLPWILPYLWLIFAYYGIRINTLHNIFGTSLIKMSFDITNLDLAWIGISQQQVSHIRRNSVGGGGAGEGGQGKAQTGLLSYRDLLESWKFELESIGIILSRWRTAKVLIRLRGCAGWSATLLFASGKNWFSHDVTISLWDPTTINQIQHRKGTHLIKLLFTIFDV